MLKTFDFNKLKHITVFFTTTGREDIEVNEKTSVMVEEKGLVIAGVLTPTELETIKERAIKRAKEKFAGKDLEKALNQIEEDNKKYPKGMIAVRFIPFSAIEDLHLYFTL